MFANGEKYIGDFRDGVPEGNGNYIWPNGAIYEGEFVKGLKHGRGKWRKPVE